MKTRIQQVLTGIGMILLMSLLFFKTSVVNSDVHNQFEQNLRGVKALDAMLDEGVVESRDGVLNSYDLLRTKSDEIKSMHAELDEVPGFLESDKHTEIVKQLNNITDLQTEKDGLIERFKTRNSIIKNSIRYFPVAVADAVKNMPDDTGGSHEKSDLNKLLRDTLTFYLASDPGLEQEIRGQIEKLRNEPKSSDSVIARSDLEAVLSHAETIITIKPEVDDLVKQIVSLPIPDAIDELIEYNDHAYDEALSGADTYRLMLYIVSVLLLVYIGFIFVKLKKAKSALNDVNTGLEHRVQERTRELLVSNQELQKSETSKNALLDAMPDSMWRTDPAGVFLDFMPAVAETGMILPADWVGKTIFDLLPHDVAAENIALGARALAEGNTQIYQYRLNENNKFQYYESRITACGEAEILTVVRNITKLKQAETESHVILEIVRGVGTTSNLKELFAHIHRSLSEFLYAENCFVALFDAKSHMLDMQFYVDKYDPVPSPIRLGGGLTSYIYKHGQAMLVSRTQIEALIAAGDIEMIGTPPAVWLGVPLCTPAGVIGVLVVQHYEDLNAYDERDLEFLSSVGNQITVVIERMRAEQAVETSRDYLDQIINAVGDPIFVKDRQHKFTLVNDAMTKFIGHDRARLISRSDRDFFPYEQANIFWEKDELVFSTGQENINEERFTDALGHSRCIVTRKRLHTDEEGNQFIVGVINDITDRKMAEEVLQENIKSKEESLALLDTILSTAPIGFAFYNCDLVIERINETLAATNNLSVEEHLGRTLADVLPEMAAATEPLLRQVVETGEPIRNLEMTGETAADVGDAHHWLANFYPVKTKMGEMLGVGVLVQDITQAKVAEEALRSKEAKFRDLFDNAPVAYHELDINGCFTRVNRTEEALLGYTEAELKGRRPWEIIGEETSKQATTAKLAGKMPLQAVERTFIRKDGSKVSVLNEDRLIYAPDGSVTGIRSTLQDITQRKVAEDELLRSEDRFQMVTRATNDVIWDWDLATNDLWWNESMYTVFGYEKGETGDLDWWLQNIHADDAEPMAGSVHRFLEGREDVWTGEYRYKRADGSYAQVLDHGIVSRDSSGKAVRMVGSMKDITERKRAEGELKASEERFQSAFDNAPFGIGLTSPDGEWVQVNQKLCETLGYTKDEMMATSFQAITDPHDLAASLAIKEQMLSGEMKSSQFEKRYIHKQGSQVLALTSLSLVRDAQGEPQYFISQIQDVTETRLLEEKVQRGQKLESIGQLAAGIAHEINTPTQYVGDNVRFLKDCFQDLNVVLEKNQQFIELSRTDKLTPEFVQELQKAVDAADVEYLTQEVPKAFTQALDGVERISKIVRSMKDFAHPGSNEMKSTDLNNAIESTVTVASNEWKYVANVVTEYDPALPAVPCLAGEFNQVILNMIVNASHAIADVIGDGTGGKGVIKISTRRKGDLVEIKIGDSGAGMTEDVRKKIFDPFFTTKAVGKGTGQGLAISHTVIVEKHKGTIDVESTVGEGTTFTICLPIERVEDEPADDATDYSGAVPAAVMSEPSQQVQQA